MNHELVSAEPLSHMPVDREVLQLLGTENGFGETYLDRKSQQHQAVIQRQVGRLTVAMDMSEPLSLDPAPVILSGDVPDFEVGSAQEEYDGIRQDPTRKFAYDTALVSDLLLKLGPTNQLKSQEGLDAGIALGKVVHLLETDFGALPESEQLPERRTTEALLREELALLWRPTTPKKFENSPHKAFMFDLSDPNIFSEDQINTLSEPDRWKLIGARLSDEAADMFQAIAESSTAEFADRLTAGCRMTDMRIRSLRIQAGMAIDRGRKQELYDQIATLNTEYMGKLAAVWEHPSANRGISDGQLFELFVVGQERDELIKNQDINKMIRLALPREDSVHPKIFPYTNQEGVRVNMSVDAVVEDTSGKFVQAYQVKAMTEDRYEELQALREEQTGKVVYLHGHTQMRFADSYDRVTNGINLSPLWVSKRAA